MYDLVSVIVPVYNVAPYLERCLNSLVHQTYPHLEILLVNDGSTDGSGEICDLWQKKDNRIRVIHKPNGGLSDARNHGMVRASGAFIGFLDSDDWYDLRFVEVMLGALLDTGSDIAECDYLCTDGVRPAPDQDHASCQSRVFEGRECFLRFLRNDFFVSVCNKLYRRSVLGDQLFLKGVYHEDESWTYKIFSNARRVCRLSYTGYFYYQRPGSIVHTQPSKKRLTDAFAAGKDRIDFIENHYPEYAPVGYAKMMYTCMYLFSEARSSEIPEKAALQEEIFSCFRSLFAKYLHSRQYRKEMWRFCFFRMFPNRYCALYY